ncbi:MAG: hypothetical protein DHS20C12_04390 [Pseudohongiella sp.]|nr:MAG: hypothetical protein DHS20C12_04390 [Pseudohongiella sp.]
MVKHKSGETLLVRKATSGNTAIPAYSDYYIVDISSDTVSIRYPGNNTCIEFLDLGVRCRAAGNIAELLLANSEPLPTSNSPERAVDGISPDEELEELPTNPANPFEALRNAQNARTSIRQDGNGAEGRFTPRRISPEDVPEGMRVIATPFGDRLVEQ